MEAGPGNDVASEKNVLFFNLETTHSVFAGGTSVNVAK